MESDIIKWFEHIQQPREELGGLSICPFARAAILAKQYSITKSSIEYIKRDIEVCDTVKYKVCIFTLPDYNLYSEAQLTALTKGLNDEFKYLDKVVLDNDPRAPFVINGVTTSFEHCYLWVVQSLSDLTEKHEILKKPNTTIIGLRIK